MRGVCCLAVSSDVYKRKTLGFFCEVIKRSLVVIKALLVRLWKSGIREVLLSERQAAYNVYKHGTPAYTADAVLH